MRVCVCVCMLYIVERIFLKIYTRWLDVHLFFFLEFFLLSPLSPFLFCRSLVRSLERSFLDRLSRALSLSFFLHSSFSLSSRSIDLDYHLNYSLCGYCCFFLLFRSICWLSSTTTTIIIISTPPITI